jgi:DNA-binding NarL/FixJ family response regulator
MRGLIAGRDAELASVRDFVASVSDGAAALVLQGEAGVGKTTVWAAGADEAEERGALVLRARPAEGETALSFSGLGDLFDPVLDEVLGGLPELQRRALSHALVLEPDEGPAADSHAIGVAVLRGLRGLGAKARILIAVDDVQWLDPETTAALAYAGRRLRAEPVGLLLTCREHLASPLLDELRRSFAAGTYRELHVQPLGLSALHEVVVEHLELALPAPLLAEVHDASGGNPFYALEIVRTLRRRGGLVEAGQPLPVPESLHDLVHGRLLSLPEASREFLLAVAADPQAAIELVEEASGVQRDVGLAPALEAKVVELTGEQIRFTHPLLSAGIYELAEPGRREEVHAALADLVDDPEARGRHLAVSVTEPNRAVAVALDEAAERALARGAPRAAALLLERARALTPPGDEHAASRRALDAASAHHEAGDTARARSLLEAEVRRLPAGNERARALFGLGRVRSYDDDLRGAAALFEQAAAVAEPGSVAQAIAREGSSGTLFRLRERLAESVELSARAAEAARVHDVSVLLAESLATKALSEAALGRPEAVATANEAIALQDECLDRPILRQPRFSAAVVRFWHDDLVGARREYEEMAALAADLGDESSIPYVRVMLGQIDCALGRFRRALDETDAGRTIAEQAGQRTLLAYLLAVRALAEAHLGLVDDATRSATQALELAGTTSGIPAWIFASWALGHLALARGDTDAALERFEPLRAHHRREGIEEPGALPFLPDGIEALLEAGRLDEAVDALDGYQAAAERLGRQRGIAAARRCRGLLAAATEDLSTALEELEAAVLLASRNETPFEHARALVALGAAQRRAKRRREARDTLEKALAGFERLRTGLWADRARAELTRISGRAPAQGALTPAESRIAALVAEGKTNREVAAALFLSERTVEGHLSRVYGKLGVRSRTELARKLPSPPTREAVVPNPGDSPV